MSRTTPDTAVHLSISFTGLSPSVACLPMQFNYRPVSRVLSKTPTVLLPSVWPVSLSLAATYEISVDLFSSPYLDVSVQAVPSVLLWIHNTVVALAGNEVSPFGNPRIDAYLPLPVAYRSLSRPSSALSDKAFTLCSS